MPDQDRLDLDALVSELRARLPFQGWDERNAMNLIMILEQSIKVIDKLEARVKDLEEKNND